MSDSTHSNPLLEPTLVLAPHLTYPLRAGDSILSHHRWVAHSKFAPVDIVGANIVLRCVDGRVDDLIPIDSKPLSKVNAAVKTLGRGSHYIAEKFITASYSKVMRDFLSQPHYKVVVFSYFWTALAGQEWLRPGVVTFVETINDEVKWFQNLANGSKNILENRVAQVSLRWVENNLPQLPDHFILSHLTAEDEAFYKGILPSNPHVVVPIGTTPKPSTSFDAIIAPSDQVQLSFVGSLNTVMNRDALKFFAERFFPTLRESLGESLKVNVIGRDPSQDVIDLAHNNGWNLIPNASSYVLEETVTRSLFTIIPVEHSTGAKLKIPESLSLGVPILATTPTGVQLDEIIDPCLVSDSPSDWLAHINEQKALGRPQEKVAILRSYAKRFSWGSIADSAFDKYCSLL